MKHSKSLPYLLALPGIAVLVAILYPFLTGVWWSFTSYRLTEGGPSFNGGQNYLALFTTGDGLHAILVTLTYAVCAVVTEELIGTGLAYLLNLGPYGAFFRTLIPPPLLLRWVIATLSTQRKHTQNG